MTPVNMIKDVVQKTFPDFQVFTDSIPGEYIEDYATTQVLIKETQSDIGAQGDMTFNTVRVGADVQIFYGTELDTDMLLVEIKLMKSLEQAGWVIGYSQPRYLDLSNTDVQQTIKIISINNEFTLEELGYDI